MAGAYINELPSFHLSWVFIYKTKIWVRLGMIYQTRFENSINLDLKTINQVYSFLNLGCAIYKTWFYI